VKKIVFFVLILILLAAFAMAAAGSGEIRSKAGQGVLAAPKPIR